MKFPFNSIRCDWCQLRSPSAHTWFHGILCDIRFKSFRYSVSQLWPLFVSSHSGIYPLQGLLLHGASDFASHHFLTFCEIFFHFFSFRCIVCHISPRCVCLRLSWQSFISIHFKGKCATFLITSSFRILCGLRFIPFHYRLCQLSTNSTSCHFLWFLTWLFLNSFTWSLSALLASLFSCQIRHHFASLHCPDARFDITLLHCIALIFASTSVHEFACGLPFLWAFKSLHGFGCWLCFNSFPCDLYLAGCASVPSCWSTFWSFSHSALCDSWIRQSWSERFLPWAGTAGSPPITFCSQQPFGTPYELLELFRSAKWTQGAAYR